MSRIDSSLGLNVPLKVDECESEFLAQETPMILNELPTVVLADDHECVRNRAIEVLGAACCVVASVDDGYSSVEAAEEFRPDLIILDICMPALDGIQAAREIRRRGLSCKIIFLTVQKDPEYVHIANQLGASYVLKTRMHLDLPVAVKTALAEGTFVSPFSAQGVSR